MGPGTKGVVVGHALAGGKFYPQQYGGRCLGEKHHKGEEEWPMVLLTPNRCGSVFRLLGNCPYLSKLWLVTCLPVNRFRKASPSDTGSWRLDMISFKS